MNNEELENEAVEAEEITVNKSEEFIKDNKKNLLYGLAIVVVLIGGYFAYNGIIQGPKEKEGLAVLKDVQKFYGLDSFNLVVNGTAGVPSAVELADEYSGTRAGDLANFYAGTSYLRLSDFESAIEYLEKVNFDDRVMKYQTMVALADAYSETGQYEPAAKMYKEAATNLDGPLAPRVYVKAGLAFEKINDLDAALEIYEEGREKLKDQAGADQFTVLINRLKAAKSNE
jgi:tetratricopeptide (TPR) repeat protein